MKQAAFFLSFLLILFLSACSTSQVSRSENCALDRHPDSISCQSLFEKKPSPLLTRKVIDLIPSYFDALQKEYGPEARTLKDYTVKSIQEAYGDLDINIAAKLYENESAGGLAGRVYRDVGYTEDEVADPRYVGSQKNVNKLKVLRPPLDLAVIYKRIYELILDAGKNLNENEIILPGLIFEKTDNETQKKTYTLVRPGLDPLPQKNEGWSLPTSSPEIDVVLFDFFMSQGILPLGVRMYHHDTAHMVDYILHPELMPLHRKYFALDYARRTGPEGVGLSRQAGEYMNEFLIFPSPAQKKFFRDFIGPSSSSFSRASTLRDQFDSGALEKRIILLESHFFGLFDLHGGGSLDGRSLDAFANSLGLLQGTIKNKITGKKRGKRTDQVQQYVVNDSYWGVLKQMTIIRHLLRGDMAALRQFGFPYEEMVKTLTPEGRDHLTNALIDLMEQFEIRTAKALDLGITATQLLNDVNGGSGSFKKTKSYRFFKETAAPGSLEFKLFIEGKIWLGDPPS